MGTQHHTIEADNLSDPTAISCRIHVSCMMYFFFVGGSLQRRTDFVLLTKDLATRNLLCAGGGVMIIVAYYINVPDGHTYPFLSTRPFYLISLLPVFFSRSSFICAHHRPCFCYRTALRQCQEEAQVEETHILGTMSPHVAASVATSHQAPLVNVFSMRPLCTHYAAPMGPLWALYGPSMRPLCALYAPSTCPLCAHYAPSMRPLCALYAPSLRPPCASHAPSMRPLCPLYAPTMSPLCALFAPYM